MGDTLTGPTPDENRPISGNVEIEISIVVTINPGSDEQRRLYLDVEDLDRASRLVAIGRSWSEAVLAVALVDR